MARKPALYYAILRSPMNNAETVVFRVTREFNTAVSGTVTHPDYVKDIVRISNEFIIAKYSDAEAAETGRAAYQARWDAHCELVDKAEKHLRLERNNREASALDAMRQAFGSTVWADKETGRVSNPLPMLNGDGISDGTREDYRDTMLSEPDPEEFQTPTKLENK